MENDTFLLELNQLSAKISQFKLNYTFDKPDNRDFLFSSLLVKNVDPNYLPQVVDLRTSVGMILDQGSLGSCVSHSIAYQLRYILNKKFSLNIDQSRLFIYYNGRILAGYPVSQDTGISIRQGFQSVKNNGSIRESAWD